MTRDWLAPVAALGLWVAFAVLSLGVALAGGRGPLLRAKLRVGGLLLGMTAVGSVGGCGWDCYQVQFAPDPDDTVSCYDTCYSHQDSDTGPTCYVDTGPDTGADSGADTADSGADSGADSTAYSADMGADTGADSGADSGAEAVGDSRSAPEAGVDPDLDRDPDPDAQPR